VNPASMHLNDVPSVMTRVQTVLIRAARNGDAPSTVFLHGGGGDDIGIARMRDPATIAIEFPSGSDRPVVGPAVRLAKRAVRRGLRWYVAPIMEQQSRVNHMLLDVMERLRLQNERLTAEVEALGQALQEREQGSQPPPA
jgi:hypothetical protein